MIMANEFRLSYTGSEINTKLGKIDSLASKSEIPSKTSELTNDSGFTTETYVQSYAQPKGNYALKSEIPEMPDVPVQSVNGQTGAVILSAGDVGALSDDTQIPSALSELTDDSTHRVVTDTEKASWNAKSDFSGSYNDLSDKPSIPSIDGLATELYVDAKIQVSDTVPTDEDTEIWINTSEEWNDNVAKNAVLYDAQTLTEAQQVQARDNIGAASQEDVERLSNEKVDNPLLGKKISLIGDSICAGSSESTSYLGGYGKIIADRNNMAYENLAKAGSTITAETYSSTTGAAKGWICRMVESMSADADYAIVEGGYNDAWQYVDHANIEIGEISDGYNAVLDDTTYYGAFESMLKQLVTKFQGKKIGYIAVPKMMDRFDSNRNAPNFYHIALECCAKWGVPVCDLNTIIPPFEYLKTLGTVYTADGSHPTYEGYLKYYCDPIEAWMKTLTTGGSVPTGALPTDLDEKYVLKNDVSIKKAKLTLEDGTTVLIDVVVASAGTAIKNYTNLIPTSIDADGNIYNGVGYKPDTRLSSSGAEKTMAFSYAFGYMSAKGGDVVRIFDCGWGTDLNANNYICAYDSNFTFIGAKCTNTTSGKSLTTYSTDILDSFDWDDNGNATLTLAALSNIAYIRVNSRGATNENAYTYDPEDAIITVNEEIT